MFSPYLTAQHALAVRPLKAVCNLWQAISVEGLYLGCSCALTASKQGAMQIDNKDHLTLQQVPLQQVPLQQVP